MRGTTSGHGTAQQVAGSSASTGRLTATPVAHATGLDPAETAGLSLRGLTTPYPPAGVGTTGMPPAPWAGTGPTTLPAREPGCCCTTPATARVLASRGLVGTDWIELVAGCQRARACRVARQAVSSTISAIGANPTRSYTSAAAVTTAKLARVRAPGSKLQQRQHDGAGVDGLGARPPFCMRSLDSDWLERSSLSLSSSANCVHGLRAATHPAQFPRADRRPRGVDAVANRCICI
jgi:hypothetical protein